jgi:phage host-nuclease inhibitor protein Gam
MAKKSRIYKAAAPIIPLDDETARAMIARLGEIDSSVAAQAEIAQGAITQLKADLKVFVDLRNEEAKLLSAGLHGYFQKHENRLTDNGKRRSVDWPEGRMGYRLSKPSLKYLMDEDAVVDALDARNLDHFIRITVEPNKELMLAALIDKTDADIGDLCEIKQREEFFAAAASISQPDSVDVGAPEYGK